MCNQQWVDGQNVLWRDNEVFDEKAYNSTLDFVFN